MARKEIDVPIVADNRDRGKIFRIREMDAFKAERWATKLLLGLLNSGVDVPENIKDAGLAGVAMLGMQALGGLKFEIAEPLLDEMMSCVSIKPDPVHPEVVRFLVEDDIEEVETILFLRKQIWELHTNFSSRVAQWKVKELEGATKKSSSDTATSPGQ